MLKWSITTTEGMGSSSTLRAYIGVKTKVLTQLQLNGQTNNKTAVECMKYYNKITNKKRNKCWTEVKELR